MEKRDFERMPAFLEAKLGYANSFYDALILNLSKNGIYFIVKEYFATGSNIEILIPSDSKELKVPFKIVRISEIDRIYFRFGAELFGTPQEYIKFINCRLVLN